MSRYIKVEPEKWAEMVAALALLPELQAKIEELNQRWPNYHVDALIKSQKEVADLKAEVERLRSSSFVTAVPSEEYEKLKAEVEELTLLQVETLNERNKAEAEVERLTKAGDNLARASDENGCHDNGDADDLDEAIKRWNAAKEGKPSV